MARKIIKTVLRSNFVADPKDDRDYMYEATAEIKEEIRTGMFPSKVDYIEELSPVKFQGQLGSCIAFAAVALKEWQEQEEHDKEVAEGKAYRRTQSHYNLSEQWVYRNCKKIDGYSGQGTYYRSALKVLSRIGVPTEEAWPYSDTDVGKPKAWAHLIARWYTIGSYWSVHGLDENKQALRESPLLGTMYVFEEAYGKLIEGVLPYPAKPKSPVVRHAVLIVGYNDEKKQFKFKNSWSRYWGQRGYGYMPYRYWEQFGSPSWMVRDINVKRHMLQGTRNLL